MNRMLLVLVVSLIALTVPVHALIISSYNADPSPVGSGQSFTLFAYVTNDTQSPAENVTMQLQLGKTPQDTSFPFSIEPTDTLTRSLGTVPPFTTVQVQWQVQVSPQALDGTYPLVFYSFADGKSGGTLTANIQITSNNPVLAVISSTPTTGKSGEETTLHLTVKNTGSSTATDILVALKEDRTVTASGVVIERSIIPLGASSYYIQSLSPGETADIFIPVIVNPAAESQPYFIPVSFEFYDGEKTKSTSTDYIGIKIESSPILSTLVSDATPLLSPGKKSRVSVDLFNQGLGPAKFVTVSVSSDSFIISQKDFFIGTIESDDFDTIILDGTVPSSVAPGDYSLTLNISYKNEFGDPTIVEKNLP
ncbi:MAG: CARDB domain-containing protein, partial [archaeon]